MNVNVKTPSTWRFLAGFDKDYISPAQNAQEARNANCNGDYCITYVDSYANKWLAYVGWYEPNYVVNGKTLSELYPAGKLTQSEIADIFAYELRNRGMLHCLQAYFWENAPFLDVMLNNAGAQDTFISNMSQTIAGLQPDIVQLMNEPIGEQEWGTTAYMNEYITFCNRSMATYATIPRPLKSQPLTFTVNSVPFWDMKTIANQNFIVPSGCTLVFAFHYYFDWNGMGYPDIQNAPLDLAYWNNKNDWADDSGAPLTASERSTAKELMKTTILNSTGMQQFAGKPVFWEESGGNLSNPNISAWIEDSYEWAVQMGWGFDSLNIHLPAYQSTGVGRNKVIDWNNPTVQPVWTRRPGSIFNEDWSLNVIGQAFKKYSNGYTPPTVQLPYHDSFADPALPNWNKINGNWNVP